MGGLFISFFVLFFAATIYAAVILIQIGGWLPIAAGLLLICSYFTCGSVSMLGLGVAIKKSQKEEMKNNEGIRS